MLKDTIEKFLSELKLLKWGSGKQRRQERILTGFRVKMSQRDGLPQNNILSIIFH